MSVTTDILNFLRDANYKVGEIGIWLRENKNSALKEKIDDQIYLRRELLGFMSVLYEGQYTIKDGYLNFLDWPDKEILAEINRLRYKAGLNDIPYLVFTNYTPVIVNKSASVATGGGGTGFPAGNPFDLFQIDQNDNVVALAIDPIGGHEPNETIDQVFP